MDPASAIIETVIAALKVAFDPDHPTDPPPLGGGSTVVHFMAGDGVVLEPECESPFLWVRLSSRYRSEIFPDPAVVMSPCGTAEVITVELGVSRCIQMSESTDFTVQAEEAMISLDDSWRLSRVLCLLYAQLNDDHQLGFDTVTPYGPEGGIVAWVTTVLVGL